VRWETAGRIVVVAGGLLRQAACGRDGANGEKPLKGEVPKDDPA
jgi:hypothetical protein